MTIKTRASLGRFNRRMGLLTVLWLSAASIHAKGPLPLAVEQALSEAQVPASSFAAVALPMHRFGWAFEHNAQRPMQPASTMKVLTAVIGLDTVGANRAGRTELFSTGEIQGDVLTGDLYLRGGADPEFDLPKLWQLLFGLRQQGVREVAGRLVQDRTLFNPPRIDVGLPPFDESPEFPYNGIPDALHLDANLLRLSIRSDGDRIEVTTVPALQGIRVSSAMKLTDTACQDWDDDWETAKVTPTAEGVDIELQGGFPRRCSQSPGLHLVDRVLLTDRLVRAVWQSLGGSLRGGMAEGATPPQATRRAVVSGRAWAEVARGMNKRSDNPITRILYLSMGARAAEQSSDANTLQAAHAQVLRWFEQEGIPHAGLVLDNGSGLSRSERISPMQLAKLLKAAHRSVNAADILAGLPIAGVDGTLRNRFKTGPAHKSARLKTGTLRNVVALAGFVPDQQGRLWVVALMVNDEKAPRARPVLEAFVNWVASGGVDSATSTAEP